MSRSEPELWSLLEHTVDMEPGEAKLASLEDLVRHADAGGFFRLAFFARYSLARAYGVARQWDRVFPLFSRSLHEHDQNADQFGQLEAATLRRWYLSVIQSMAEFPEITAGQIDNAFTDLRRRFVADGHNLREFYDAHRWVAQLRCDWDAEQRWYGRWLAAGGPRPGSVWDFEVDVERLVLRGDDTSLARAREIAAPVLAGEHTFADPPAPIQCLMLVPLVRAGAHADAALAYRRSLATMDDGVYPYEYRARHVEFCALTGNEAEGLLAIRRMLHEFPTLNRPAGKMEFAAASALLLRRLDESGSGAESVPCGFDTDTTKSVSELRAEMTDIALDLAARFDTRNGTSAQGDRIRAMIAARPVAEHVPLGLTRPVPRKRKLGRGEVTYLVLAAYFGFLVVARSVVADTFGIVLYTSVFLGWLALGLTVWMFRRRGHRRQQP